MLSIKGVQLKVFEHQGGAVGSRILLSIKGVQLKVFVEYQEGAVGGFFSIKGVQLEILFSIKG